MSYESDDASRPVPTTSENPSVFDFLYQDVRRVGSILAQFDLNGVLQSITQSDTYENKFSETLKYGGALNLLALQGKADEDETTSDSAGRSSSRAYDPLWRNSLALLALLRNRGYLARDLASARVGQMVLVSGTLSVFDVPVLAKLFEDPDVFRRLLEKESGKMTPQEWAEKKAILKLFVRLPLSIQASMAVAGAHVWSVLKESCMEAAATDLSLKYGLSLEGTWNMLGILDALPAANPAEEPAYEEMGTVVDVVCKVAPTMARIGRPRTHHSLTPLLIFREVEPVLPSTELAYR